MSKKVKLPKYVKLNDSALVLREKEKVYFRHAGNWSIRYKIENGKLLSVVINPYTLTTGIDNVELIEITEQEWRDDNKGYIR